MRGLRYGLLKKHKTGQLTIAGILNVEGEVC